MKIKYIAVYMVETDTQTYPYVWSVRSDNCVREYRFANDDSIPIYADQLPKYVYNYLCKADCEKCCIAGDEKHTVHYYRK